MNRGFFAGSIFALLLLAILFRGRAQAAISIHWVADPADSNRLAVEVSGLSAPALQALRDTNWAAADWRRLLAIHAEQNDLFADVGLPAMAGTYRVLAGRLRFEPQFPFEPGVHYRAVLRPDRLPDALAAASRPLTSRFVMPARSPPRTTVVRQVYPTADVLPENLLKFYVHFSAPMSGGRIYSHIHLRDDNGKDVELPFLEIDEELWDPAMTRLTLFIDPGRIKRGVKPLEEIGPALEEGKRFTLVISDTWKDAAGAPLKQSFERRFRVGPSDREPPNPASWRIEAPRPNTRDPLVVVFGEPMDHALARRVMRVLDGSNRLIGGETELADHERRWTFLPARDWTRGAHVLLVQTTIEDLAGNNIGKRFEVDLFEGVQRRFTNSTVRLPFEVR